MPKGLRRGSKMPSKRTNFVILTSSRTGSTWLIDVLNRQSGLEAHGELFLGHKRSLPAISIRSDYPRFVEVPKSNGLRPLQVIAYLNRLYSRSANVGFKLMYSSLREYPVILPYLSLRRVRVIHLLRQNQLDVIVSNQIAEATGVSHVKAGVDSSAPKVHVNTATLLNQIVRLRARQRMVRRLIRASFCASLEVKYEALLAGAGEFNRILDFLGVQGASNTFATNLSKRATKTQRDSIDNYEEVKATLRHSPFVSMLR